MNGMVTVLLEYINFPQMLNIAININFTIFYYAGIMLIAFNDLYIMFKIMLA